MRGTLLPPGGRDHPGPTSAALRRWAAAWPNPRPRPLLAVRLRARDALGDDVARVPAFRALDHHVVDGRRILAGVHAGVHHDPHIQRVISAWHGPPPLHVARGDPR